MLFGLLLLGSVAFMALVVWMIVLGVRRHRVIQAEWRQYVKALGADATGSFPQCTIRMQRDGLAVEIDQWSETTGSGDDRSTENLCRIRVWPSRPGLAAIRLGSQGFFARVMRFFGAKELEIGELEFDQAFVIDGPSVEVVTTLLGPEARRALLEAKAALGMITLVDGALAWRGAMFWHPAEADQQVRYLLRLAQTIDA